MIIENLSQVVNGVRTVAADAIEIDVVVAEYGATTVVVARVAAKRAEGGSANARNRMMSVLVRDAKRCSRGRSLHASREPSRRGAADPVRSGETLRV